MARLSDDKLAELKEAFNLFDSDGDGCITTKELGTVMRALGRSPTEAEIKALIKEVDPDGRGMIDLQEFVNLMSRNLKETDTEADLKKAWTVFDKEGKGFISTAELKHVLSNVGEKLSPDELNDLCKEVDADNKGKVTYDEFVKVLLAK